MFDLSTIITTHAEGDLISPAAQSCLAAAREFELLGKSVEKIIVMDRPDNKTKKIVERLSIEFGFDVYDFDYGDQGLVRNHVVKKAKGNYIAFLDGDDLWSENWLSLAFKTAENMNEDGVFYPEFNWFFEGSNNILCQIDATSDWFDIESLRTVNLWDALCFCPRLIYQRFPFYERKIRQGFAYEDWNWNRRISEQGILQSVVKDTIIFKRRRADSQGALAQKRVVMAEPTKSCYYDYY